MINYMRMSKLKVDVSYSQSKFEQSRLTTSIPILIGSMQSLVLTVFGVLAVFLKQLPCVKKSIIARREWQSQSKIQQKKYYKGSEKGDESEALKQEVEMLKSQLIHLSGQLQALQHNKTEIRVNDNSIE